MLIDIIIPTPQNMLFEMFQACFGATCRITIIFRYPSLSVIQLCMCITAAFIRFSSVTVSPSKRSIQRKNSNTTYMCKQSIIVYMSLVHVQIRVML